MAFGRKAGWTQAYEYGCLAPLAGADEATREMRGKAALWNQLVELEEDYAADLAAIVGPHLPGPREWPSRQEALTEIRQALKQVRYGKLPEVEALEHEFYVATRDCKTASGLYWCNGEDVLEAFRKAHRLVWYPTRQQLAARLAAGAASSEVRRKRWRGEGSLFLRWQQGLPVSEVFGGQDTLLRIEPVDMAALISPIRSVRRKAARTTVQFRVRSEDRQPVWVELPLILHRPLPADGRVQSARLIREEIAGHERWKLVLSVRCQEPVPCERTGRVGLSFGWRQTPEGLRVAVWLDDSGRAGQLVLPHEYLAAMERVEALQGARDQRFVYMRDEVRAWLARQRNVPEWLALATRHIEMWRSPVRLRWLARLFREHGYQDADGLAERLESWDRQERWDAQEQRNLQDARLGWRREQYRLFAARLAARYGEVIVRDIDLARIAADTDGAYPAQRRQRQLAGVSTLKLAIASACRREGVRFKEESLSQKTSGLEEEDGLRAPAS